MVGFGPCGIFAALVLAQMGLRPIVLERGKPVRERTSDTWGLWRQGVLHPESNVQFGEGGAGTFSRRQAVQPDQRPAAPDAQGADRVRARPARRRRSCTSASRTSAPFAWCSMVEKMRAEIEALGGEIRFEQRVIDLLIEPTAGTRHCAA